MQKEDNMSNDAVFKSCIDDLRNAGVVASTIRQIENVCQYYQNRCDVLYREVTELRRDNMELRGLVKNATTLPVR
jgi:hypothetical protein